MRVVIEQIKAFIAQHNLIDQNAKIVLGLSGGPDSVFLLHLLADMHNKGTIELITAHLDHEWRSDSHKDTAFCKTIADNLGIPFVTAKMSELTFAPKWEGSKEEYGRLMRRHFLQNVRKQHGADAIALAHHLQDQQETFLIRLIRGASLTGLTSMRPKHGAYIRPLLETNKTDIIAYLDEHTIDYLTDPSNESPEFLRNRIRSTVLPPLRACDARFDKNFLVTLKRLQETDDFLQELTVQTFATLTQQVDDHTQVDIPALLALHPVMRYRVMVHWLISQGVPFGPTQRFLDEIIRFLKQPGSKAHEIHEVWRMVKKKQWAYIQKTR